MNDFININISNARKERDVQKHSVLDYARAKGFLAFKIIKTNIAGFPDVLLIKDSKCFFIEVKTKRGKLSKLQAKRLQELKDAGVKAQVVYGDEEAVMFINECSDVC